MDPTTPPQLDQIYVHDSLPTIGHKRMLFLLDLSTPMDTLELYVALMTCLWGAWLIAWDLLSFRWFVWADLSDATNILNLAFTFMPQWAWGVIGCVIGTMHLLTRMQQIRWRRAWLLSALMFWAGVTLTILVRVPYSTGVIAYGGLAFASGFSYLRLYILDTRFLAAKRLPSRGG